MTRSKTQSNTRPWSLDAGSELSVAITSDKPKPKSKALEGQEGKKNQGQCKL